jgi:hypothetical protein
MQFEQRHRGHEDAANVEFVQLLGSAYAGGAAHEQSVDTAGTATAVAPTRAAVAASCTLCRAARHGLLAS